MVRKIKRSKRSKFVYTVIIYALEVIEKFLIAKEIPIWQYIEFVVLGLKLLKLLVDSKRNRKL